MLAARVEAREAVGHHRAEHGGKHGRSRGDDEAVDQPLQAAIGEQRRRVVDHRGLRREPHRRHRQVVAGRLDRGDHAPNRAAQERRRRRSRCARATLARRRAWRGAPRAAISRLRPQQPAHQHQDHDGQQDEEEPASRGRHRQMELLKPDLVEVEGGRVGLRARPAAGQHEDDVEQLDGVEQPERDGEQHHRRQLRERDIDETSEARGRRRARPPRRDAAEWPPARRAG